MSTREVAEQARQDGMRPPLLIAAHAAALLLAAILVLGLTILLVRALQQGGA